MTKKEKKLLQFENIATGLLLLIIFIGCTSRGNENKLEISTIKTLDFPEPSGLAISADENFLWTVSDHDNTVYSISFDGKVLNKIKLDGKNLDLEGVAVVDDTTIAVIFEKQRKITLINIDGEIIESVKLDLQGEKNAGLEGIAYDKKSQKFYVLNEKKPGLLLELNRELEVIGKKELDFAADYSAIAYDDSLDILWILSDEDRTLFSCTTAGEVRHSYKIDVEQPEGVVVDRKRGKVYIVSDPLSKLYCFEPGKNIL